MMPRFRLDSRGYPEQVTHLRDEFKRRGWRETTGDDWQFLWSFDIPHDAILRSLRAGQMTNHFPGITTVHFKDEFARHVRQAGERTATDGFYDFLPPTYSLARDQDQWRADASAHPERIWILKPTALTGGRGVRILAGPDDLTDRERGPGWIVQRYIDDPLLLPDHPYKHVFRIYTLVTSLDPLVAYLYPNGPVKFTSRPFGTSPDELGDRVRHLTNPTVQLANDQVDDPIRLSEWTAYRRRLAQAGLDGDLLWERIRRAVIQALIATRDPILGLSRHRCSRLGSCYELLGFDVTVDAAMRPWLLECNASPSLSIRGRAGSGSADSHRLAKEPMIADSLTLLGVNEPGRHPAANFAQGGDPGDWQLIFPAADASEFDHCFDPASR